MIDKRAGKEREVIGTKLGQPGYSLAPEKPGKHNIYNSANDGSMTSPEKECEITSPSTDLAKHWDGFKVGGIKPAYEPIIWAVKPPEGSYVDNVLKWGVGAVNVDECRVGLNNNDHKGKGGGGVHEHWIGKDMENRIYGKIKRTDVDHNKGRFPANVILSHHPECQQVGVRRVKGKSSSYNWEESNNDNPTHITKNIKSGVHYGNETVESWDCHPDCAVKMLDEQSGASKSAPGGMTKFGGLFGNNGDVKSDAIYNDSGGASRFFYCAKASRGERNAGLEGMEERTVPYSEYRDKYDSTKSWVSEYPDGKERPMNKLKNVHPTVKPIKLFEWLIKLVTREGQIVLDPFIGSGTTAIAAHNTGRKCIGIEKEDDYLEIAKKRISYWQNQPKQNSLNLGG